MLSVIAIIQSNVLFFLEQNTCYEYELDIDRSYLLPLVSLQHENLALFFFQISDSLDFEKVYEWKIIIDEDWWAHYVYIVLVEM